MKKFELTEAEKEKMRQYSIVKLNGIGGVKGMLQSDRKCMFITIMVQYLWSLDTGIECTEDGAAIISNAKKLREYCRNDNMFAFVTRMIKLRNRIVISYGMLDTLKELDDVWAEPYLGLLCNRLDIKFDSVSASPTYARLMEGN